MSKKKLNNFQVIDIEKTHDYEVPGVIYINDNSARSDFIFSDWKTPIIRSKNKQAEDNEELIKFVSEKILLWKERNQDCFLLIVTFNEDVNFSLNFSPNCNFNLIHPVYENFEISNVKFNLNKSYSNSLIKAIEYFYPKASCFNLNFNNTIEQNNNTYTKERIFEETLIFASLAMRKALS